jgi:hypothetical protein
VEVMEKREKSFRRPIFLDQWPARSAQSPHPARFEAKNILHKLVNFFPTIAADHYGYLVNAWVRYHCLHRLISAVRQKLAAQMFLKNIV